MKNFFTRIARIYTDMKNRILTSSFAKAMEDTEGNEAMKTTEIFESPHVVSYSVNRISQIVYLLTFVSMVILGLNCPAQSVVDFYLTQFTGNTNDTTLNIQAQNNPIIYHGQFYWWPQYGSNILTTNGLATITLVPGRYTVSIAAVSTAWNITVTNSATPLNAAYLSTQITIYNGINSLAGAGVTTDGHGNYTVIGIGSATNFTSGQNTTWTNIGGNNQVNITGTLTNNTTGSAATAGSVTGSQAAIIAAATMNYPDVLSFLAANTNLSTEAQNELNAYSRELTLLGQATNLIDLFPFNPRFNPGSNCLSFMGRTEYWSNIVTTAHGVSGVLGGRIVISNMPDLRTNTMVITWRFPNRIVSISQYFLAGAVDPVSANSEWMYGGPWPSAMITQGTTQPAASAGVWNEFEGNQFSYNFWSPRQRNRHVSVLSSSNGVFQAWDNGIPCGLTTAANATTSLGANGVYSSGVTLANPLTTVMIFNAPGIQNSIPGGMNGEIESVQVFQGAATSNMVLAAWWAGNELENENTWYTFITDSQGSPDECPTPYTNWPAFYMMNNGHHYNQVCWDHFGVTGQQNFDYTNAYEVYRITTLYAPHGRFTTEHFTYALNINDLYNGNLTPAQIWPFYVTWSGLCLSNNVEMHVMNTSQISTNNYAGGFTYSPTIEVYRETLNAMMLTNSFMFARVIDKDSMISQFDLNTNNLYSFEGLHFTGTNGWVKNQQIGKLMDDEVNFTPLNYTNGIH
jgi:hypothetical protein